MGNYSPDIMVFVIDIGNSNIVISAYHQGVWKHKFRYETKGVKQDTYYQIALRQIIMEWSIASAEIEYCVFSSVVPDLNPSILEAIQQVLACPVITLGPELYKKLDMHVPLPYEIGSDLVANAYGALKMYGNKVIVADFGTALSFVAADEKEGILGVTIAPGLKTASQSLGEQTAQLPVVPLQYPESYLGKDTVSAIQAGIMYGYTGLFKNIIEGIKQEFNNGFAVIVTGGQAPLVTDIHKVADHVNPYLTLEGMKKIGRYVVDHQNNK